MNTLHFIVNWTWLLFVALLVSVSSCNREDAPDCFQSAGTYASEERSLDSFSAIELNDYIQYELYDTSYYGVLITAPGNLISRISATLFAPTKTELRFASVLPIFRMSRIMQPAIYRPSMLYKENDFL